ncbi:hypothetical protein [Streptomyces tsukubensis]|uniref:hypothetical protein n=1 Tax=Streptomyces tsukubensis TaxID=83656 RepID=UPI00344B06BD
MRPPFQARLIDETSRSAARDLVRSRVRWLSRHALTGATALNPLLAALTPEGDSRVVGFFEGTELIGCLTADPAPAAWDHQAVPGPALTVTAACGTPGRGDVARLMTLWARRRAHRAGLPWVRCRIETAGPDTEAGTALVRHLITPCRWNVVTSVPTDTDGRLALMRIHAAPLDGLDAYLHDTVPHPPRNHPA